MRVLLIGASGFLGAHVRRRALEAGLTVITAGRADLAGSPRHLVLDLAAQDPAAIGSALAGVAPHVVVNCTGATSGSTEALAAANITGTYALATAMLASPHPTRLVHLGSAAEYGRSDEGESVGESAPARPAAPYGATKLAGTRLVQLARQAGLDAVVLRVFNPVGAGAPESGLPGSLAAQLRDALRTGADVGLGPLHAFRDFVDARDVADAVILAAQAKRLSQPVLNIGSGVATPVRALVKELVGISGFGGRVHEDDSGSARSGGLPWQQADITMARKALGWQPRRDLTASLIDLWRGKL